MEQLKCFLSRLTFYDDIQHRFKRTKKASDNIEDIYDGQLYKELCAKGLLCSKDNISFLMNTDGFPVFKSSKVSIWPLYFIINELDYRKRLSRENMLFAGLWFGEKQPTMWTFLKPHMKALERLKNISPTLDIKRLLRSISEHLKYWKANELRSFLLYYGLPVLYGLLPDEHFEHYFYFVRAIYLLLLESISEEQLKIAEQLLQQFSFKFSQLELYELRYQTLNIHQLLHLVDNVRDLGPLYTHSCFSFENKNGFVLKVIHGTQFIDS